jgi:glycerol uptake facilitator-like aquaporin
MENNQGLHERKPYQIGSLGLPNHNSTPPQSPTTPQTPIDRRMSNVTAFAGRLGGNQTTIVDRDDANNLEILTSAPDAAPGMTLKEQFDCRPLRSIGLWKAAMIEGVGTMFLVFLTCWANISPNMLPVAPDQRFGYFDNAAYLGPLTGGLSNFLILTLFTFIFGIVSGAHLNPTITIATFVARLCSFPRAILYLGFQLLGASFGGFFVRAGYGTRDFKVGGCYIFPELVPTVDAFAIEFIACSALLFCAFGVGLDPRQQKIIPPALAPFLVGMSLGTLSWMTGYSRYGYGGASMNPARCFGALVGSHFQSWHWINWVADICACIFHGLCYWAVPPGLAAF